MTIGVDPVTALKLARMRARLRAEFDEHVDGTRIDATLDDAVAQMLPGATVLGFVPVLAYRVAHERLTLLAARWKAGAATWEVVYVSRSAGCRGQLAAALTRHLSRGCVSVHSAGTALRLGVDPTVAAVLHEIGVDPGVARAARVTDDVMRVADVVVTMGQGATVVELPPHARCQDWRVGDPLGAPLPEVRRVREEIEHRVRDLLSDLGVAA